jgi:hypothetical protein
MGRHITLFETQIEYEDFLNSKEFSKPNITLIKENNINKKHNVKYHKKEKNVVSQYNLYDIIYWDGNKRCAVSPDKWDNTLGRPIGVCVIPSNFTPDKKARMISLKYVSDNGQGEGRKIYFSIDNTNDLDLYTRVPTTDNQGSTTTGSVSEGYLPGDNISYFAWQESYVDPCTKYRLSNTTQYPMSPSPYYTKDNEFKPNTEYYKEIVLNNKNCNVLSDFNGLYNTSLLINKNCWVAQYAWEYSDGVSDTQWYLPSAGELGFIPARCASINEVISKIGGYQIKIDGHWTSNVFNLDKCWRVHTINGGVGAYSGDNTALYVRPFAII